jgi:hypothetical protein
MLQNPSNGGHLPGSQADRVIRQVVNDQRTTAPSLYRRWPSHRGA